MNTQRRVFLTQLTCLAGVTALNKPFNTITAVSKYINTLHQAKNSVTIYHTNDINGHIDAAYKGAGGLQNIKAVLANEQAHGLLLDAAGFLDAAAGTGRQKHVISLMNGMGYHAAAIGAPELSRGADHLGRLAASMQFTLLNCNYELSNNLRELVKPCTIINSGKLKIGITAVGAKIHGTSYHDAIQRANHMSGFLKNEQKCDLVICLSHLGYKTEGNMPDNYTLAARSENIDMIIGGGAFNKLTPNSLVLRNNLQQEVILSQTARHGLMMGKTVFSFDNAKQKTGINAKHFIPGTPAADFAASFSKLQRAGNIPGPYNNGA